MRSMYADYILEREGKHCIEIPKQGFVTYQFWNENECYLEDMFVAKDHRRSGVGTKLHELVIEAAKEKGCKTLVTSVKPSANGSTDSIKAIVSVGFEIKSSGPDWIIFKKGI